MGWPLAGNSTRCGVQVSGTSSRPIRTPITPGSERTVNPRWVVSMPAGTAGTSKHLSRGEPGAGSAYRVALVVQSPGRVPHQAHRAVAAPPGGGGTVLDRRAQRFWRPARKLREGTANGVEDVRVGATHLG